MLIYEVVVNCNEYEQGNACLRKTTLLLAVQKLTPSTGPEAPTYLQYCCRRKQFLYIIHAERSSIEITIKNGIPLAPSILSLTKCVHE